MPNHTQEFQQARPKRSSIDNNDNDQQFKTLERPYNTIVTHHERGQSERNQVNVSNGPNKYEDTVVEQQQIQAKSIGDIISNQEETNRKEELNLEDEHKEARQLFFCSLCRQTIAKSLMSNHLSLCHQKQLLLMQLGEKGPSFINTHLYKQHKDRVTFQISHDSLSQTTINEKSILSLIALSQQQTPHFDRQRILKKIRFLDKQLQLILTKADLTDNSKDARLQIELSMNMSAGEWWDGGCRRKDLFNEGSTETESSRTKTTSSNDNNSWINQVSQSEVTLTYETLSNQNIDDYSVSEIDPPKQLRFRKSAQLKENTSQPYQPTLLEFQPLLSLTPSLFVVRRMQSQIHYVMKVLPLSPSVAMEHAVLSKMGGRFFVQTPFLFAEGGAAVFVMEKVEGGDLRGVLEREVYLSERDTRNILAQLILGLQVLHSNGIVHRDLKPQNVLVSSQGQIKIADFGLAAVKCIEQDSKASFQHMKTPEDTEHATQYKSTLNQVSLGNIDESLRNSGSCQKGHLTNVDSQTKEQSYLILGTPNYIPPEVLNREVLSEPSIDCWCLGVMAYEMMTGALPFAGQTIEQIVQNTFKGQIELPPIGKEEGCISQKAAHLIKSLLERNPQNRLGSQGLSEIKTHPFFAEVQWDRIFRGEQTEEQLETSKLIQPSNRLNVAGLKPNAKLRKRINEIVSCQPKTRLTVKSVTKIDFLMNQTENLAGVRASALPHSIKSFTSIHHLDDDTASKIKETI